MKKLNEAGTSNSGGKLLILIKMMNTEQLPLLYSFRRCPYAIRARLAIKISNKKVELREVNLSDKPKEMLERSAKGTVPVLVLTDGTVIDESRDIMIWALMQHDPQNWLPADLNDRRESNALIDFNDNEFKQHLDHYKYAARFPEQSVERYRQQAENFLQQLEQRLTKTDFLLNNAVSLADMAIFPFIRQFAFVDKNWFDQSQYLKCQTWLKTLLDTQIFADVMKKLP